MLYNINPWYINTKINKNKHLYKQADEEEGDSDKVKGNVTKAAKAHCKGYSIKPLHINIQRDEVLNIIAKHC